MFGYVTPLTEELKVKEHIFYKSVYCGLCRTMGKRVCSESRVTLSYDIVFLALVRFALTREKLAFKKGRCMASPTKKKVFLQSNPTLEYSAAAGALLAYYSLADHAEDSCGIKKPIFKTALLFSRRMRKKASLPELDAFIKEKLDALCRLEKSGDATPDSAADIFGALLCGIFACGLDGDEKRIAEQIGYHVGKWIYLADAADDFAKDKKEGAFNPFQSIDPDMISCSMYLELEGASAAFELIDRYDDGIKSILQNILYLGMKEKTEKILNKYLTAQTESKTEK